jgi:hypothetical protein
MKLGHVKSLMIAALLAISLRASRFLNFICDELNFRGRLARYRLPRSHNESICSPVEK